MNTSSIIPSKNFPNDIPTSAKKIFHWLEKLPRGQLVISFPNCQTVKFGNDTNLTAYWQIHDWRVIDRTLRTGDIGFAESYRDGDWSTPNLLDLLRLFIQNRAVLNEFIYGSWWGSLLYRLKHWSRRNTKAGSAQNIHDHYDLGNQFYALWLDCDFNYSSGYFQNNTQQDLFSAQKAKLQRALAQLSINEGERLLEIGCGWGSLAMNAIQSHGVYVTGITLSQEQLSMAQQRIDQQGLSAQADIRLLDYRDLPRTFSTPFDAIVSIEMFEAVGKEYWGDYFRVIKSCLKPTGKACIQTIVIDDRLYDHYQKNTDFIKHYIFPGGFLPSSTAFIQSAQQAGLKVIDQCAFGADYAKTLNVWRENFLNEENSVRALGFDTAFIKLWDFYLAYCQAAFMEGNTDVLQYTLVHSN